MVLQTAADGSCDPSAARRRAGGGAGGTSIASAPERQAVAAMDERTCGTMRITTTQSQGNAASAASRGCARISADPHTASPSRRPNEREVKKIPLCEARAVFKWYRGSTRTRHHLRDRRQATSAGSSTERRGESQSKGESLLDTGPIFRQCRPTYSWCATVPRASLLIARPLKPHEHVSTRATGRHAHPIPGPLDSLHHPALKTVFHQITVAIVAT